MPRVITLDELRARLEGDDPVTLVEAQKPSPTCRMCSGVACSPMPVASLECRGRCRARLSDEGSAVSTPEHHSERAPAAATPPVSTGNPAAIHSAFPSW